MRSEGRFKNVFDQSSAFHTFKLFFARTSDMTIFLKYQIFEEMPVD